MELIKSWVYNPRKAFFKASKNGKAKAFYKYCLNKENCEAYKNKKCILLNDVGIFGNGVCPYGKANTETGYTTRASKFSDWIKEREELKTGQEIKQTGKGIFIVGDYVYLDFRFMDVFEFKDEKRNRFYKRYKMVKLDEFTLEFVNELLNFKPRTMFGNDIIKDYAKETLPLFLKNIKEKFPDIYKNVDKIVKEKYIVNNIGREAYINTMSKGSILKDCHGSKFVWNGEHLICEDYQGLKFKKGKTETKIEVDESETYKIIDESQVDKNTKFKD